MKKYSLSAPPHTPSPSFSLPRCLSLMHEHTHTFIGLYVCLQGLTFNHNQIKDPIQCGPPPT